MIKAVPVHLAPEYIFRAIIPLLVIASIFSMFSKVEMLTFLIMILLEDWLIIRRFKNEGKLPPEW